MVIDVMDLNINKLLFNRPYDSRRLRRGRDLYERQNVTIELVDQIGENEYTRWGFKQLVDAHAAQILNADALVLGGISEWKKVADYAMASHILIAPHGDQEIHTHLVSAVPNGLIAEYYDTNLNSLLNSMFKTHIVLNEDGTISAPSGAGIGVDIDFESLKEFQTYPKEK